jgi:Fe-S-cluster containining protein
MPAMNEAPAMPHNPCATCGACCRSYIVPVSGYDIWLISSRQRLSPEQFLVACPQAEPGLDGFHLDHESPAFGLALDKRGAFEPTKPCVFLVQLGGDHARCGVYDHRPAVCRAYPMSIWQQQVRFMDNILCPPNSWSEDEVRRPSWRASMQRLYMHLDIYHEVVARWNARVARASQDAEFTLHEYFSYLMNVYDRLFVLESEVGDEAMAHIQANWPTSPRPDIDPETAQEQRAHIPWVDYLLASREMIDQFYPEIAPQPVIAFVASESKAVTSKLPSELAANRQEASRLTRKKAAP